MCGRRSDTGEAMTKTFIQSQINAGKLPGKKVSNPFPEPEGASVFAKSKNAMKLESTNTKRKSLTASDNYQG
tara:strand:- start:202 stop:417 length:216 start_codon:yes stop_codon:yes gene_type:complete